MSTESLKELRKQYHGSVKGVGLERKLKSGVKPLEEKKKILVQGVLGRAERLCE